MDRVCCVAYLLYQSDNDDVKHMAVNLVTGEISLNIAKKMDPFKDVIQLAEKKLKESPPPQEKVCQFVENFLFTVVS
ncbi:hypothetical protein [Falsibacillus pallidus]|uniref:hypothetical protein n=1 Tax=Falsibacillus pallidus TaxID=493781 RepID=UPI003D984A7D